MSSSAVLEYSAFEVRKEMSGSNRFPSLGGLKKVLLRNANVIMSLTHQSIHDAPGIDERCSYGNI